MSSRHRVRGVIAATLALGLVAGCSSGNGTDDAITVEVFGPYRTAEADAFVSSLDRFSDRTGIEVRYTGSADFVDEIRERALSGRAPDIAVIPQPALVGELIEAGVLAPLSDETQAIVAAEFGTAADVAPATHAGFGVPFRSTIKSLVWFRPEVFIANEWTVPTTVDELSELIDTIDESGAASPWCLGIRSGAATGWPATDWVEDLLLRTAGTEAYDHFAAGRFDLIEAELTEAFELFDDLVDEGSVPGGRSSAVVTDITDPVDPLFAGECAMFKQANFALSWMPDGTNIGDPDDPSADVAVFVFPSITGDTPPLVIGGDTVVAFERDTGDGADQAQRDAIDEVMAYLASADGAADWAAEGGYLSSRVDVERDSYFDDDTTAILELVAETEVARFDASDQLPIDFGFDVYLPLITRWVAGSIDTPALVELMAEHAGDG